MTTATAPFLIDIDSPIGALKTQLSKLLMSVDRIGWLTGSTTGRFDVRRTSRMLSGSERVFKARTETPATTTAVSIIVDLSGSMVEVEQYHLPDELRTYRIDVAAQCAYAIATAVERSNCEVEVIGFGGNGQNTSTASPKLMNGMDGTVGTGTGSGTYKEATLFNIKPFGTKVATKRNVFQRLRSACIFGTPDYHGVRTTTEKMVTRTEQRKLVIVLTDGIGDPEMMREFAEFSGRVYKIPVLAIGIQTRASQMARSYTKYVTVNSLKDLSTVAIRSLIEQIESKE